MQLLERTTLPSLAAGAETYPLQGRQIEIAPFSGYLEIAVEGSAAGLRYDVMVGGRQIALGIAAGARNALPVVPTDLSVTDEEVIAGERITLRITNPTAGALTPNLHVRLSTQKRTA
jgi:hypothetical protein